MDTKLEKDLIAGYFGMGGNSFLVTHPGVVKNALKRSGYRLLVSSEWDYPPDSDFDHTKWDINTWRDEMLKCDVILAPQRYDVQPGKSAVKVTVAMALGLPVIASPLQAYKEIIRHGENGYLATTEEDWYQALEELKSSEKRRQIGQAGLKSISGYTLEAVTDKWVKLCHNLLREKKKSVLAPVPKPKPLKLVDIIIASYNNVEYLKLLISSIKLNTTYPHDIIISDAGSNEETWEYLRTLKGFTIIGEPGKRLNFSQCMNAGIKKSNTEFLVILNNDLVVSKSWLEGLVDKMEKVDRLAVCGPTSNCDLGFLWNRPGRPDLQMKLEKSGLELHPKMRMPEILPHLDDLYTSMEKWNLLNKGKFIKQDWIAAYCCIMARSAINEVSGPEGPFDPIYNNGGEDLDLMIRLSNAYFSIGTACDVTVFHFGAVARSYHEQELNNEQNRLHLVEDAGGK